MINSSRTEEFIGHFGVSYKDGDNVYAYDDISHGLYKINLNMRKVDLVISFEDIHRDSLKEIKGITKYKNEIILIPFSSDFVWVFYDIEEKKIRYDYPFKDKINLSSVITNGNDLFLIPENVYNPIVLFSLDKMKIIKTYEKWYTNDPNKKDDEKNFKIWGASSCNEMVIFPIINSKSIVCMNFKDINIITLDIPVTISSVSIYKDKIWILPISGEYIYNSNLKGEIVDRVNLFQNELRISANDFIRVVAIEELVVLFPMYEKNICVYQSRKKKILQIENKGSFLYGRLFACSLTPYWDYVVEDEILHILPCDYRYKKINISVIEDKEYALYYGENIDRIKYWKMARFINQNSMFEKSKNGLDDFFQYLFYLSEDPLAKENKIVGRKIWEGLNSNRK